MNKKFLYTLLLMMLPLALSARVSVTDVKIENMTCPLGIDTTTPRFSWKTVSDSKNVVQTAYEILVASSPEGLEEGKADYWQSGTVKSSQQLWVAYAGKQLRDNDYLYIKVRVTTNKGKSAWSEPQHFSIGLLSETHWSGRWIGLEDLQPGERKGMYTRLAVRYLRKEFKVKGNVKRAMAYVSGLGLYQFYVNGKNLSSGRWLQPAPTDYRKTVMYNTFDVTAALKGSKACLAISLGNGRYFPMRQEKAYKVPVFGFPKCRINVIVEYADGTRQTWATDSDWRLTTNGPVRANNEYDGEEYDARMEMPGWTSAGYDDSKWMKAQRCVIPDGTLRAQMMPAMIADTVKTVKVSRFGNRYIVDFGRNIAGMAALRMYGAQGDTIRIRYAEKLSAQDALYTANLRNARSEDIYVCSGMENGRLWNASFVYHGFRYVEISGWKGKALKTSDINGLLVSDDMGSRSGCMMTSDTTLNKVLENAFLGIKDNYKGMPVDCPQRNERQPWLGDRTVGCLGESFVADNERLYTKWMRDISEGMRSDGAISNVTPSFWNYFEDNVTWPAVFPFACDMLYEQFGNTQAIRESYPYIKKWLTHIFTEYEKDNIITKDKYGDWCVPPEKLELIHSQDPARQTDGQLISTAYGIRILKLMAKFARLQGLESEAGDFDAHRLRMTAAFNDKFLTVKRGTSRRPGHVLYPDSVFYGNNTATANLLPMAFGIVPDSIKTEVVKNLVANIITAGNGHVTCGVIGISWLLRGLSDNGFADVAYLLATTKTYPSWGYMAENGATTVWELWNGDKADPAMNSGNHVMLLGDLLTWCYQYLGGIRQTEDSKAYKHIVLKPSFEIQDCFSVDAAYNTPYGKLESTWHKTLQKLEWDIEVPCNTTADVCLPNGETKTVGSGKWHFSVNIPTADKAIVKDEFLYDFASFPQAHASTITELKNGDLVASYFGGTKERNPDVCIWVSRKAKGSKTWEKPVMAADGVFRAGTEEALAAHVNDSTTLAECGPVKDGSKRFGIPVGYEYSYLTRKSNVALSASLKRKACWNPVLFTMPDGEIWLFYKIGKSMNDWTGWIVKSRDGGRSWSDREVLPEGFLGPIKNKPELIGNRLVCGSSTESDGWRFHVEILDLKTGKWKYVGPVDAEKKAMTDDMDSATVDIVEPIYQKGKEAKYIYSIQPSILRLKDGRLQVLMRTHNARLATSFSSDGGDTWTPVTLTEVPNNQSGTDAVTLRDGRHVLIYNDFETLPGTKKGPRTPLSIAISDDGSHWRHLLTLEDSPISQYSYPAIIEGADGTLHCVYTWRRERIAYKNINLKK